MSEHKRIRISDEETTQKRFLKDCKTTQSNYNWVMSLRKFEKPFGDDVFPEFKTERERIKAYTELSKGLSIAETFAKVYNVDVKKHEDDLITNANVNDTIELIINGINGTNVDIDNRSFKNEIQFAVDLNKLSTFANGPFPKKLSVKITEKKGNKLIVNPLAGTYEKFVSNYKESNIDNQYKMTDIKPVKIKNLKLMRGGYAGDLIVDELSTLTGCTTTVKAFIPGSQIVMNIENDFNKWVGKEVEAFVTTIIPTSELKNETDIAIICSRKSYLKHLGNINTIQMFKDYTENNNEWKKIKADKFTGIVTGVINTSKKCGVFVEIPEFNITTLLQKEPNQLANYKPNEKLFVKIDSFEESIKEENGQKVHELPYTIEDNILKKITVRPIFVEA